MSARREATHDAATAPARGRLAAAGFAGTIFFGGLHALASLYWALGGEWLLDTVGRAAVDMKRSNPTLVVVMLLGVTVLKVAGIAVPILNERGRLPFRRVFRVLSWLGGGGLVVYGVGLAVMAQLSLAGQFGDVGDRRGMVGHAYLWDPLFALWGLSLVVALFATRRSARR